MIGEYHSIRLDPVKKGFPWRGLGKLVFSMPFIYSLILPIALLDALATLYIWVCFPIYGIALIDRGCYINLKRRDLSSLNFVDRLNCHYCSYANGVLRYVQRVAAETERMWCPIRLKAKKGFKDFDHHCNFVDKADKETLQTYFLNYRQGLSESVSTDSGEG